MHDARMAKVTLITGLIVVYGYACELFFGWYSGNEYERFMLVNRILTGPYAWIGDGSILACQDDNGNPGVYRWDLFSAPTLLYRGPCPATAG